MERLKGIPLKLNAIDEFLAENPKWVGKLVFAMIGISAAERGSDYRQTTHDVRIMVDKINEKYKVNGNVDDVIYFEEKQEREMKLAQRLAFLGASDIFMCTAAR